MKTNMGAEPADHAGELQEQAMADDRERKAAEAKFKKSERATEGAKAMSEYNAERQAERAKTGRLRELRLAKEAADKSAKVSKENGTGTSGAAARLNK
jgi:hypothetical protein